MWVVFSSAEVEFFVVWDICVGEGEHGSLTLSLQFAPFLFVLVSSLGVGGCAGSRALKVFIGALRYDSTEPSYVHTYGGLIGSLLFGPLKSVNSDNGVWTIAS